MVDFGIRGLDLAYALQDDYEAVIFVDALPRGEAPGTVYLIEPEIEDDGVVTMDTHGMDPVKVIKLSRALGAPETRLLVVGCEPEGDPERRRLRRHADGVERAGKRGGGRGRENGRVVGK